jgi:hypothetical protein
MRVPDGAIRPLVAAVIVSVLAACGSSTSPQNGLTAAELAGTYDLSSITFQGTPTLTAPTVSGTLTLTLTRYSVTLTVPDQGTQTDSGTYTVSGNQWTQSSDVNPVQSVGTASLSHDTLDVNVTTAGMQVATVWVRQR